jgi:hypothetical protein
MRVVESSGPGPGHRVASQHQLECWHTVFDVDHLSKLEFAPDRSF